MTAFLWALLTACIWGVVPLLEKAGLAQSDPTIGVFARSIGVLVGVAVFGLWRSPWKALLSLSVQSFALLALGGFLASLVGQWTFYHALKTGLVSQTIPVAGAYPLVSAMLGWWILREPLTLLRVAGVSFVVLGIALLRR